MLQEDLKAQIVASIKKTNPCKIILFGSHAYSAPGKDSDIDLLVVTDDEFLPQNFSDKNKIYLRVADTITEIEKRIPIDLIVHTKAMHRKFNELNSMFARKIATFGVVLYEKHL